MGLSGSAGCCEPGLFAYFWVGVVEERLDQRARPRVVGCAELVVRVGITGAAQLKGRTLATPQLGNTQDVAPRYWLKQQGYHTDPGGGGDVAVVPQSNALLAFAQLERRVLRSRGLSAQRR